MSMPVRHAKSPDEPPRAASMSDLCGRKAHLPPAGVREPRVEPDQRVTALIDERGRFVFGDLRLRRVAETTSRSRSNRRPTRRGSCCSAHCASIASSAARPHRPAEAAPSSRLERGRRSGRGQPLLASPASGAPFGLGGDGIDRGRDGTFPRRRHAVAPRAAERPPVGADVAGVENAVPLCAARSS